MKSMLLAAVAALALSAPGADAQALAKLAGPNAMVVTTTTNPCMVDSRTAPCISHLTPGKDKLTIQWGFNSTMYSAAVAANAANSSVPIPKYFTQAAAVQLKVCFTKSSQLLRPWRATKPDVVKNKQCLKLVAKKPISGKFNSSTLGLGPLNGTPDSMTWPIPKILPTAVYYVRAFILDANGTFLGYGDSSGTSGFFMTERYDALADGKLRIGAGVMSGFAGSLIIAIMTYEGLRKPKGDSPTEVFEDAPAAAEETK